MWRLLSVVLVLCACGDATGPDECIGPTIIEVHENGRHVVRVPCRDPCEATFPWGVDPYMAYLLCMHDHS